MEQNLRYKRTSMQRNPLYDEHNREAQTYPDITNKCHHATRDECETETNSDENPSTL